MWPRRCDLSEEFPELVGGVSDEPVSYYHCQVGVGRTANSPPSGLMGYPGSKDRGGR